MHVFLYEWITGGGLVNEQARLPPTLLAEGSAMISALAADFRAIDGVQVSVLRDMRLDRLSLPGCEVIDVYSPSDWRGEFERLARGAEWTMIVAPEFDGILRKTVRLAQEAEGRLLNASDEFIALTANKHATAERLRWAGVPAPAGRVIEEHQERLPADFEYPAVLKPLDGAGSQHLLLVGGPGDEPPPYPWPRRIERFHAGQPASVAAICGPQGRAALPPCRQLLSSDGRFSYRGGGVILEPPLVRRATSLALRALDALPRAHGYVGIDLVLGAAADGADDVVIEINPRLTTSYVGLRRAVQENLAEAMLRIAQGLEAAISPRNARIEFAADGAVWILD
ncbi:MAG: ATP-grasp domain-containing protein [Pirellulales bacterium]|nr:ATP-grasp domain-containing protein [Pirellulales bacterium]